MIALSAYKLATYLVDSAQFSKKNVVWENIPSITFTQRDSSRNNCFICKDKKGQHSYFFKQTKSFSENNVNNLRSEAQFYAIVRSDSESTFKNHIPIFEFFDDYNTIIVSQLVSNIIPLNEVPSTMYKEVGRVLKLFHTTYQSDLDNPPQSSLKDSIKPLTGPLKWINDFRVYKPLILNLSLIDRKRIGATGNPYKLQLLAFIEDNHALIHELRTEWNNNIKGLIHGDSSLKNFAYTSSLTLKMYDFEYVSYGAYFWDTATFIANLLCDTNLPSIFPPISGVPTSIRYPLIQKFCSGYGILEEDQQEFALKWVGVYFLQLFLDTEEFHHLQYGIELITNTKKCVKGIFK